VGSKAVPKTGIMLFIAMTERPRRSRETNWVYIKLYHTGRSSEMLKGREFLNYMNDVLAREGMIGIMRAVMVVRVRRALGGEDKKGESKAGGEMSV
jgi:hypothetical protein